MNNIEVYSELSERKEVIVISHENPDFTNPIFSTDKTAAIIASDNKFIFLNLKTKQGKMIGITRTEAREQLKTMNKMDDFPDF